MIYCLIYISDALKAMQNSELKEILEYSQKQNKSRNITGYLVYVEGKTSMQNYGRFIQVLEGPESEVTKLFKSIVADERHEKVTLIKNGIINSRNFSAWEMGFERISLDNDPTLQGFFNLNHKVLSLDGDMNNNMLLDFMKSFYKTI